jgi:hypothetical protein
MKTLSYESYRELCETHVQAEGRPVGYGIWGVSEETDSLGARNGWLPVPYCDVCRAHHWGLCGEVLR